MEKTQSARARFPKISKSPEKPDGYIYLVVCSKSTFYSYLFHDQLPPPLPLRSIPPSSTAPWWIGWGHRTVDTCSSPLPLLSLPLVFPLYASATSISHQNSLGQFERLFDLYGTLASSLIIGFREITVNLARAIASLVAAATVATVPAAAVLAAVVAKQKQTG